MKWLDFLLRRKLVVGLLVVLVIALGFYSFSKLDMKMMPEITFDGAMVMVDAGQMSSLDVEKNVTEQLEMTIASLEGVKSYASETTFGSTSIEVTFEEGRGDELFPEFQSEISRVTSELNAVEDTQTIQLKTDSDYDYFLDVYGGDMEEMLHFADKTIKSRLESLDEVSQVLLTGSFENEVVITLDQDEMRDNGLIQGSVVSAINEENQNVSVGELKGESEKPKLRWNTQFENLKDVENMTIATPEGIITLSDVAEVKMQPAESQANAWKNGKESIFIPVARNDDYTEVEMAEAVRKEIEAIEDEGLVGDFKIKELAAKGDFITTALDGVTLNVIIGGLIAIAIVMLFLRNIKMTFIIGVTIPTSILLTFVVMWLFGYSFNLLTLVALGLGIGMMVDAAIVILESIYKKYEQGVSKTQAIIEGTKEVGSAVIASMLTTIVVFVPIAIVGGDVGDFVSMLSVVIIATLVSSVFISFTLIPALSHTFIKKRREKEKKKSKLVVIYGRFINWLTMKKRRSWGIAGLFLAVFIAALFLITSIPANVMPDIYNRQAELFVELDDGATPTEMEMAADAIHEALQKIDDVTDYSLSLHEQDLLWLYVNMKSEDEATTSQAKITDEIIDGIRDLISDTAIKSADDVMNGQPIRPVAVQLKGNNFEDLSSLTKEVIEELKTIDNIVDINDPNRSTTEKQINIDDEAIKASGLVPSDIRQQLEMTFMKHQIGIVSDEEQDIPIYLSFDKEAATTKDLENHRILMGNGNSKSLSEFVTVEGKQVPMKIQHDDGERVVNINAGLEGEDLGAVNRDIQQMIDKIDMPDGVTIDIAGDLEAQQEVLIEILTILLISIFLVYIVMAIQFNNLIHPFVVMSIIPMTFVGVIVGLFVTQRELNVLSAIGVVILIGIVLNNAILLIDRVKQMRERGYTRSEALVEAGQNRMRPIFMTTLTTVGGMLPLALATGSASNFQSPLATVIIFGLLFATLITLVLIPAIYINMEDVLQFPKLFKKRKSLSNDDEKAI